MERLFLIDHSLRDTGGHHFDYVRSVANAARERGIGVTIGCHQDLAEADRANSTPLSESLHQLGDVRAVFRETVYQGESWLAGLRRSKRTGPLVDSDFAAKPDSGSKSRSWNILSGGWLSSLKQRLAHDRRERVIKHFSAGCRDFFYFQAPRAGDQVLVAAASELEVAGAVEFLAAHPDALMAKWHFLFHFNLFDGWTSEYESQRVAALRTRRELQAAIRKLPADSLRFYATTETLADQFNSLGAARFAALPYPISSDFLPANNAARSNSSMKFSSPSDAKPVTLVCAGATRREKGQASSLQGLVDQINGSLLQTGKAKLVVQRPEQKRLGKSWLELSLGDDERATSNSGSAATIGNPIEYAAHPLPRNEYRQLLGSADVGLFCYDARSYFSRCAGILVEMLACGKPVIVPAGTWLADQIQQPIQHHIKHFQGLNVSRNRCVYSDFLFDHENVPGPDGVWSFDEGPHPFVAAVDCERDDRVAVVRFDWHWPKQHGIYARVECIQRDAEDRMISETAQAIGTSRDDGSSRLMFRLQPDCHRVEWRLTNAFGRGTVMIRNFSMDLYSSQSVATECPVGAVGVIAASQQELPQCVAEVVAHISHYRKTAQQFSPAWIHRHHPQRTVDWMFGSSASSARAA